MSQISQHILQRVAEFIARNKLLPPRLEPLKPLLTPLNPSEPLLTPLNPSEPLLTPLNPSEPLLTPTYVGLSGGPDSVALLHILHTLGYACKALHCNFHLRGAESDRDQQFCEALCASLGIPLEVRQFDTFAYMKEHHLSVEMAARELRYNWWSDLTDGEGLRKVKNSSNSSKGCLPPSNLSNLSNPSNPSVVALGHHQDDSIETMLMNLMRGTGIHGMTGIVARNEAKHIIRPLLCLSRQDILDYLSDNGLSYVIDSTNAENETLRNQIRNQLLPLMEQMVPQVRQGIARTMEHLQGTEWFADRYLGLFEALTEHHSQWGIEWDELNISKAARQFPEHLEDYLHEWTAGHAIPSRTQVVRTPKLLYTMPFDEQELDSHRPQLTFEEKTLDAPMRLVPRPSSPFENTFDADTLTHPLTLRRWKEGDRIAPLGMKGRTRLISDLFTDAHYSPMQKATTWLLCDATGDIVWAIGLHMNNRHKVSPATKRIIKIRVTPS